MYFARLVASLHCSSLDCTPSRQKNFLAVCNDIVSFVPIDVLTLRILSPSVFEFVHPPLSSGQADSFFESCACSHLLCVQKVDDVHGFHEFPNALQVDLDVCGQTLVLVKQRLIPIAINVVWEVLSVVYESPGTLSNGSCIPRLPLDGNGDLY